MGFIGLVADAATTIQQETGEITKFFSIAHLKQLLNDLGNWSVSLIGKLVIAVIIWVIGKKIIKVLDKIVKKMLDRSSLDKGVVNFVVSVLKFAMYAILIMIVVDKLGHQTTSLLTLFGSAALAIGMSLQGSLSNFAGGILILIFKPFKVGDYIIVGTNEGTVKSIEILYTRLVTIDNKVVMQTFNTGTNSSIVNVCLKCGTDSDLRLTKTHVTTDKTVHRLITLHIRLYFLSSLQLVRSIFIQETGLQFVL